MSEPFGDSLFSQPCVPLIVVGVVGIIVWHLVPRTRPTARLIIQIGFFAVMSGIVAAGGIAPHRFQDYRPEDSLALLVILAKSLWWIHLAWALIGFVRLYVVLDGRPREARLLQDLIVGVVYIGMSLSVLAFVFGIPIGTLVATSGVVAIILGLALQNTLGDVFSGIALTLGRPYGIGDCILLADGTEGRVVESNWRATHILTGANNLVVLPNSLLAKLGLTNVSRPDESHLLTLTIRIAPTRMPAVIEDVLMSALSSRNTILREPPPIVALKGLDATALEADLQFRVADLAQRTRARNEVLDLVYRHCKAAGLLLAIPSSSSIVMAELPTEETAVVPGVKPFDLIGAIPIFAALTPDEKRLLAEATIKREFRKADVIAREGELLSSLMIVRAGTVALQDEAGERSRLAPGDFFGETGLLAGIPEAFRFTALTSVTIYEIGQESLSPLLLQRPALAEDMAEHLAVHAGHIAGSTEAGAEHIGNAPAFLKAIRTIFHGLM